jgi:glutaredoxin
MGLQTMNAMKQQCYLVNVWFTWLGLPALAIMMGLYAGWWAGVFVLVVGIFAQALYIRIFPSVSHLLGYGSVEDEAAVAPQKVNGITKVMLYTANVCPFCPIVKQRLGQLQREMGLVVEEVDVTFRPELIRAKGFRSVPVIEAGGKYWVGNATSAQLVAFLTNSK